MVQPAGRWRMVGLRVPQPPDCFPALCPSWQKVRVKVPPHACPCMKSLQQLSSAQERFHHSLMCTQGGRTPDAPITLLSEKTRDSLLGPRPRTLQRRSYRHTSSFHLRLMSQHKTRESASFRQ